MTTFKPGMREWVNYEISQRTQGRSLNKFALKKIYIKVWREAKSRFKER